MKIYYIYTALVTKGGSPNSVFQKTAIVLLGENELAMYAFKNNQVFHVSVCNHLIDLSFLRQTGVRFIDVSYWEDMTYTIELVTKVTNAVLLDDVTYHYIRHQGSLSHYQTPEKLEKQEILRNVSVIHSLKEKCRAMQGKPFLPYLSYNLEMNSFYAVCYIMRYSSRITPKMTSSEMHSILRHPIPMAEILKFRHKKFSNLVFWVISNLPIPLFIPSIWLLGKINSSI